MDSRYDVVIFGVTGFTGKRMLHPAHKLCISKGMTVAVAGRSSQKIQAALQEMQQKTGLELTGLPVIVADVSDENSLKEMAKRARVVVNCCGPFILYGEPVVKACIASGTSYVDITGEPLFMDRMLLKYNDLAKSRGVYVVPACGLDCVPCDLGVVFLQDNFPGTLNSVELYIEIIKESRSAGGSAFNTGTWESIINHLGDFWEYWKVSRRTTPKDIPDCKPNLKVRLLPHTPSLLDKPAMLFPTGDKPCIDKTQAYLYHNDRRRPVQAHVYLALSSYLYFFLVLIGSTVWMLLSQIPYMKNLMLKHPKYFTLGYIDETSKPSDEDTENTVAHITLIGEGWRHKSADPSDQFTTPMDQRIVGRVRCKNPGYGATCIMAIMCAKMLATERTKLPKVGGVYSPGAAFAKTSLIRQLNENGVPFELISIPTNV